MLGANLGVSGSPSHHKTTFGSGNLRALVFPLEGGFGEDFSSLSVEGDIVDKESKAPVLEFWLTKEQWVQFTRVMERCHRVAGGPVGPADCLELVCRTYLERRGDDVERGGGNGITGRTNTSLAQWRKQKCP